MLYVFVQFNGNCVINSYLKKMSWPMVISGLQTMNGEEECCARI